MEFSRQEYWSGLAFPSPGDLPDPGIELTSLVSLHGQADSLPLYHLGSPPERTFPYKSRNQPSASDAFLLSAKEDSFALSVYSRFEISAGDSQTKCRRIWLAVILKDYSGVKTVSCPVKCITQLSPSAKGYMTGLRLGGRSAHLRCICRQPAGMHLSFVPYVLLSGFPLCLSTVL